MEEMRYIGAHWGSFTDDKTGEVKEYFSVFLAGAFEGTSSKDYHHEGLKPDKFSLVDPTILPEDLEFGDLVRVQFTRRGRISSIERCA